MKTVCPLLWNHSFVSTSGSTRPCCRTQSQDITEDWLSANFTHGVNTPAHKTARDQMRNGQWPSACGICKRAEEQFGASSRTKLLEEYNVDYSKEPTIDNITTMDVKFNNVCNLSCIMCNPTSSSKIAEFANTNKNQVPFWMQNRVTGERNWNENGKLEWCKKVIALGNLKVFKTTGGEPFAQKHFWQLIDWCIENEYTYFEIHLTTNGTKFSKPYLKKLLKFRKIKLLVSCDGTDKVYEYIRFGSKWDKFVESIDTLVEFIDANPTKFYSTKLHVVLQALNCHNISDIKRFADSKRFKLSIDVFMHPINTPLAIEALPKEMRFNIIDQYAVEHGHFDGHDLLKFNTEMVMREQSTRKTAKLIDNLLLLDRTRSTNYRDLGNPIARFIDKQVKLSKSS